LNGCDFLFASSRSASIACPEGKAIEMTSAGCTMVIGPQELPGGVGYENNATMSKYSVAWKAKEAHYTQSGPGCATRTGTDLTISGAVLLAGTQGGTPTSIWWE
jgi:hypothetical protein